MEIAEVYKETIRKARKEHTCETGFPIPKGTEYCYISGIFEGDPFSLKINLFVKNKVDELNKRLKFDKKTHYADFWEVDWTYKELAEIRFYLMDLGISSNQVIIWKVTNRMDQMWLEMQYEKRIQGIKKNIKDIIDNRLRNYSDNQYGKGELKRIINL